MFIFFLLFFSVQFISSSDISVSPSTIVTCLSKTQSEANVYISPITPSCSNTEPFFKRSDSFESIDSQDIPLHNNFDQLSSMSKSPIDVDITDSFLNPRKVVSNLCLENGTKKHIEKILSNDMILYDYNENYYIGMKNKHAIFMDNIQNLRTIFSKNSFGKSKDVIDQNDNQIIKMLFDYCNDHEALSVCLCAALGTFNRTFDLDDPKNNIVDLVSQKTKESVYKRYGESFRLKI